MNNLYHRLYDIYCQNQTILLTSLVDSKEFKWTRRFRRENPFNSVGKLISRILFYQRKTLKEKFLFLFRRFST